MLKKIERIGREKMRQLRRGKMKHVNTAFPISSSSVYVAPAALQEVILD
jgi:hypothetical protein